MRVEIFPHHGRDGKVPGVHLLSEPIHLTSGIAENDGLSDGQRLVQIAQRVQFPLFALDPDVKLFDT